MKHGLWILLLLASVAVAQTRYNGGTGVAIDTTSLSQRINAKFNSANVVLSSGYGARDSLGIIVNAGAELLYALTLDSTMILTGDTTQMTPFHDMKAVSITHIRLFSNSTVNLTPRFMFNDTLGGVMTSVITSPSALTTARVSVTLSSLNNVTVPAGAEMFLMFDAKTTVPKKLSVRVYGIRTY